MGLLQRKKPRRKINKASKNLGYDALEEKNLLATVFYDAATQDLAIDLTASGESAMVNIQATSGLVTVNNSSDIDSNTSGFQQVAASELKSITITGDSSLDQGVTLQGDFSNAAGQSLQSISASEVSNFWVQGDYQLAGDLDVDIQTQSGFNAVGQFLGSRLRVGGTTTIDGGNGDISFGIVGNNDFVGDVSVSIPAPPASGGGLFAPVPGNIIFSDANDISFSNVSAPGDFTVAADGNITDAVGSTISVDGITRFDSDFVTLGDNSGDSVNFNGISSVTSQNFELSEDSTTVLLNVSARNLNVTSTGGIFDGNNTGIVVSNQATFDAAGAIRIGNNVTDTFNAGLVNFNSNAHVDIMEDSGTVLTGTNTANSLSMFSTGDITDDATATLDVAVGTMFEGANITIGDSATDQFNTGTLQFVTAGDLRVTENSDTHITSTLTVDSDGDGMADSFDINSARRAFLTSDGAITDDADAQTNIVRFSTFTADSVNIGDSATDMFNTGSIGFVTTGTFSVSENSATNIIGTNSANRSIVESAGAITNRLVGTSIDVAGVASFEGTEITLGETVDDSINFGALELNSAGIATISEDSGTHLTRSSTVDQLILTSAGGVTDAISAAINVTGNADISGTSIWLGEDADDDVNAGSFTLNSAGVVNITEDTSLHLAGTNTAGSMSLTAFGNITDSPDADIQVTNLLSVTGHRVNLGSEATDFLQAGQLQFNSTGNTFITADSGFEIAGSNDVGNRLTLVSSGNITDTPTAEIRSINNVSIFAVDKIIGELATDCFDIVNGGSSSLFVDASGNSDVVLGGC